MTAIAEGSEGDHALAAGITETRLLGTDLVLVNLRLQPLDDSSLPDDLEITIVERNGPSDRDPVDAVLAEIDARSNIHRLIIGMRRRSPVGKALLGSISQRLLGASDGTPRYCVDAAGGRGSPDTGSGRGGSSVMTATEVELSGFDHGVSG
ncbi:universal stress protein [Saccharopolyspora erythraea]|uniref:universal stress protein n=1 Tax=Saccharopolyspora erythraea TaxID=1836 RepID=UPI001BA8F43E|nr:universal stress protein [Saccharopolyspora erythraea]